MADILYVKDEDRDLTYTIECINTGTFHAKCTHWPQFAVSASTYLDALDGIRQWSKLKLDDEIFYKARKERAIELPHE